MPLPVQYGGAPLHVPSSWQWRVALPTSIPPGRQEYCSTEPYVQLWVPDTTALGGTPGSPQEIAAETVRDGTTGGERRGGGGVLVCKIVSSYRFQMLLHYMIQLGHCRRQLEGEGEGWDKRKCLLFSCLFLSVCCFCE